MRILLVNKFHYNRGGADRHYLELGHLLKQAGHEVRYFSQLPLDGKGEDDLYYVPTVDMSQPRFGKDFMRALLRLWGDRDTKQKVREIIKDFNPQVVHLHNVYHQLSPVIIKYFKDAGIPVVMTVHDFYVVSPNYNLYHRGNNVLVEQSLTKLVFERQIKNSFWVSLVATIIHSRDREFYKLCDRFVSPSEYVAKIVSNIYPEVPIEVMPNFAAPAIATETGDYIFYGGRISQEKGVDILLRVAKLLSSYKFKIAGTGPMFDQLRKEYNLFNVEWLG
ncbi:MAG: glycosyltransferase, partial [Candidatus Komeilibacteria bacterium]|nr:glycosyltransferase [Candidatus Komeilibacteria bacterium]